MCDLDGAKTSLESLLDEVRDLKAERDWYKSAYNSLRAAVEEFRESYHALVGKEGE